MLQKMKNDVAARISPTKEHLSALNGDIQGRLRGFRSGRNAGQQKELEENFALLLEAWGIEGEAEIPGVLRDLRLRRLILLAPPAVAVLVAAVTRSPVSVLTLALLAPPCLFGIVATCWRIAVLKNRAFTPLLFWLAGAGRKRP
jgi:hypothetical protein